MVADAGYVPPLTWFEFVLQPQLLTAHIQRGGAAPGPKELLSAFVDQALSCCKAVMTASTRHALPTIQRLAQCITASCCGAAGFFLYFQEVRTALGTVDCAHMTPRAAPLLQVHHGRSRGALCG